MIFISCYKIYTYLHVSIFWSVLFGLFGFIGYIPNHIQILRFFKNHIHSVCMVYTKSKPYYLFRFGLVRYGSVLPYWTALLADVIGNTYTFQLKLKDFNFTANHQTFTISRIFSARELAPIPSFAEGAQDLEPTIPRTVVPGSDCIGGSSCNVAEEPTTSDGLPAGLEAACEGVDIEGCASKKARVEWVISNDRTTTFFYHFLFLHFELCHLV